MLVSWRVSLRKIHHPGTPLTHQVGLLVGTLAQTKAGPEIQEANNDRLKPLAYGAEFRGSKRSEWVPRVDDGWPEIVTFLGLK